MTKKKVLFIGVAIMLVVVIGFGVFGHTRPAIAASVFIDIACRSVTFENVTATTFAFAWSGAGQSGSFSIPPGISKQGLPAGHLTWSASPGGFTGTLDIPDCGVTQFTATDGRLNLHDAFQTAAVYCQVDGSVKVLVLRYPNWILGFNASLREIERVPEHPVANTLIKSGNGAALYRLTTGQLQVNSPGLNPADGVYFFVFRACEHK